MADIVLKDRNGNDVTYEGIKTVTFDTPVEGVQSTFTEGVAVENLEIVPDFTGGDMPIAAPDGTLVKSATVKKPGTLTPENVRNGVEIGGVIGTLPVFDILENLPVALDFSGGNQPIVAPEGKAVKSAIIQRPENLLPENIAEGVDIAGITGTLAAGGSTPAGAYWETESMGSVSKNNQTWFDCNGERYAFALNATGGGNDGKIYKYTNEAWTSVCSASISAYSNGETTFAVTLPSGKTYIFKQENSGKYWYIFDGASFNKGLHAMPGKIVSACIHNGLLTAFFMSDGSIYTYSESTGWSLLTKISTTTYDYFYIASVNCELYAIKSNTVYKVVNGSLSQVGTIYRFSKILGVEGNCIIYLAQTGYTIPDMIRSYDVVENVDSLVGYGMGVQYGYMPASNFADELPRCLVLKDGKGTYNVYSHKLHIIK